MVSTVAAGQPPKRSGWSMRLCSRGCRFPMWLDERASPPVCCSTGAGPGGSLEKIDEAAWRHAWELKVFGYINLTRLVHADMKSRNNGVIVNIIGAAGERFNYDYITGSTGNAALMGFTKSFGGKSLHYGVRVVGINPGPVGTDRHVYLMKTRARNELGDKNRYGELLKDLTLGRAVKPRIWPSFWHPTAALTPAA